MDKQHTLNFINDVASLARSANEGGVLSTDALKNRLYLIQSSLELYSKELQKDIENEKNL